MTIQSHKRTTEQCCPVADNLYVLLGIYRSPVSVYIKVFPKVKKLFDTSLKVTVSLSILIIISFSILNYRNWKLLQKSKMIISLENFY